MVTKAQRTAGLCVLERSDNPHQPLVRCLAPHAVFPRPLLGPPIDLHVVNDSTVLFARRNLCQPLATPRFGHQMVVVALVFIDSLPEVAQNPNQEIKAGSISVDEKLPLSVGDET